MGKIYKEVELFAHTQPNKIAYISDDVVLSYSQLHSHVDSMSDKLVSVVSPSSSTVAIVFDESEISVILILALNKLGVTIVPLNPAYQSSQISLLIKSAMADVILVSSKYSTKLDQADVSTCSILIVDNIKTNQSSGCNIQNHDYADNKPFLITLSSGSTGEPKPIIFTEKNKIDRSKQAVDLYGISQQDKILCASPFFHSLGQRLTFLPLIHGATLVHLSRFNVDSWVKMVERHGVTCTISVSSHLQELSDVLITQPERFSSLRCLVSSSAAISNETKTRLFEALGCDFHEMYGASEVATATSLNKYQASEKPNSVGLPCIGVKIRIYSEQLKSLKCGEVGEIGVFSPLASPGYLGKDGLNTVSFCEDGFFLTGDLGYLDEDGFLYFINRKKEMIIAGGINIYPSDIERVLSSDSRVGLCVVIGMADDYLGEVPVAVIVTSENSDKRQLEIELRKLARQYLASFQLPLKYFFYDAIPLTASGKLDRIAITKNINAMGFNLSSKLRFLNKN